jgi:HEAT repeat protein
MEELLWTFEDVVRFVDHPDLPLRHWALERLTKRFPGQAGDALSVMVDDPDEYISTMAIRFLAETGDREKYGPALLARLKEAKGTRFGTLAEALARLDEREALPLILERVKSGRRGTKPLDASKLSYLVDALGTFGGEQARQALWEILDNLPGDRFLVNTAMEAILDAAQPQDIARLVRFYRARPSSPYASRELTALASAIGAARLAQEMGYAVDDGLEETLERAKWWLARRPELSEPCRRDLLVAFDDEHRGVFDVLLREAQRMIDDRGDDVAAWRRTWQAGDRPVGYRREALFVLPILEAFAAQPSPHPEQRAKESALGLALLCQLSVDRDDQGRLETAEDRAEMLLTILAEDRENVLPGIVEQAADLGPEIVSWLMDRIKPDGFDWGMLRAIDTLGLLARRYPGSCDVAIPLLIETVNDEQGDFALEACSRALEAIGPAAAAPIVEHLRDKDMARQIYLTGVLGEIPTESAAQGILDWLKDGEPLDEMHLVALGAIGSPTAIEPLYQLWRSGRGDERLLAEYLLVLCELNGIARTELPRWRRIVEAERARVDRIARGMEPSTEGEEATVKPSPPVRIERPPRQAPRQRSTRKPKKLSKRERKKRAAQRKRQKRGKKK